MILPLNTSILKYVSGSYLKPVKQSLLLGQVEQTANHYSCSLKEVQTETPECHSTISRPCLGKLEVYHQTKNQEKTSDAFRDVGGNFCEPLGGICLQATKVRTESYSCKLQ